MLGRLVLDVLSHVLEVGVWVSSSSLLSSLDASLADIIFFVAASAATAMGGEGSGLKLYGCVLCSVGGEVKNPSGQADVLLVR